MRSLKHDVELRLIKFLNTMLITLPFAVCWLFYYANRTASPYYAKGNYLVIAVYFFLYIVYCRVYEGFLVSMNRISDMIYSQSLAAFIADVILYVVIWLLTKHLPNVMPLLLAFAGQIILSALWSYLAHKWYFSNFPPKRTAIVYDQREGMERLISEYGMEKKFLVVDSIEVGDFLEKDCETLKSVETVFLCGIHSHERNIILKRCIEQGVRVYLIPRIGDTLMGAATPVHMFHLPMLRVSRYEPTPEYRFFKRLFDIVLSGIALIVMSPFMLVTAIAIKATDGGPVFYKQCRLTKDGKTFNVLKFRSMRIDAEKDGVARLSTGDRDDRITPVGKIIRKVRIDELPQLINILMGDMTIVGPRPERPEIAAQYMKELPEFALRLQVKAGLTGYAQVYGKYNTTPYDKLQMDLMYIAHPSILEDLRICFATVKILFVPESTEGVAEGRTNAMEMQSGDQETV